MSDSRTTENRVCSLPQAQRDLFCLVVVVTGSFVLRDLEQNYKDAVPVQKKEVFLLKKLNHFPAFPADCLSPAHRFVSLVSRIYSAEGEIDLSVVQVLWLLDILQINSGPQGSDK